VHKDGDVNTGRVDDAIMNMESGQKDQILSDFEGFKNYLHKRIDMAGSFGLGEEQMAKIAERVADYLADHEQPRNREEMLLQELWKVGSPEERHMLAHMLVRMARTTN
jgi:hypothetical protein